MYHTEQLRSTKLDTLVLLKDLDSSVAIQSKPIDYPGQDLFQI